MHCIIDYTRSLIYTVPGEPEIDAQGRETEPRLTSGFGERVIIFRVCTLSFFLVSAVPVLKTNTV